MNATQGIGTAPTSVGRPEAEAFRALDQVRTRGNESQVSSLALELFPTGFEDNRLRNHFLGAISDPANKGKKSEELYDSSVRLARLDYEQSEGASYEDIATMLAGNNPQLVQKLKSFDGSVAEILQREGVGGITEMDRQDLLAALKPAVPTYPIYLMYEGDIEGFANLLMKPQNLSRQASDLAIELWTHEHLSSVPQLSAALAALGNQLEQLRSTAPSEDLTSALLQAIDKSSLRPALASFRTRLAEALADAKNAPRQATEVVTSMLAETVRVD